MREDRRQVIATSGSIGILSGALYAAALGYFWLVSLRWWPKIGGSRQALTRERYYNPRTRRWTTEIPKGEDVDGVRTVRGGQSLALRTLRSAEAEGFRRGERTIMLAWSLLGSLLPAAGIGLLITDEGTRIPGLVCLVGGLFMSALPLGAIVRSRVRRRQRLGK
jgi:hypothetical protein